MSEGLDLDEQVAIKVMRWHSATADDPRSKYWVDDKGEFQAIATAEGNSKRYALLSWKPSQDLIDAYLMESQFIDEHKRAGYFAALSKIVADARTAEGKMFDMFSLVHASAEQRCRAALEAVKGLDTTEVGEG